MSYRTSFLLVVAVFGCLAFDSARAWAAESTSSQTNREDHIRAPALPRTDANGNPLRRAPTGHVSNYDEAKVGTYTLPNPLVLQDGKPVRDAAIWIEKRRPEILKPYEADIYGRVPANAPKVSFEVVKTDTNALNGAAVRKEIVLQFGSRPDGPKAHVHLVLRRPRRARAAPRDVPVLLRPDRSRTSWRAVTATPRCVIPRSSRMLATRITPA